MAAATHARTAPACGQTAQTAPTQAPNRSLTLAAATITAGLDNRKANLRNATLQQNLFNRRARCRSGYKGVYEDKGRFRVWICRSGRRINLGTYDDKITAARVYNENAIQLFGQFAFLNPLPEPAAPI